MYSLFIGCVILIEKKIFNLDDPDTINLKHILKNIRETKFTRDGTEIIDNK